MAVGCLALGLVLVWVGLVDEVFDADLIDFKELAAPCFGVGDDEDNDEDELGDLPRRSFLLVLVCVIYDVRVRFSRPVQLVLIVCYVRCVLVIQLSVAMAL